jgi:[ribosomal protein S5]-alanine N-acetyltransferase
MPLCTLPIRTERMQIVPFSEEHLTSRYVAWLNDPEVVRYSEQRFKTHTLESCRAYAESFAGTDNLFLALLANSEGHIGNMTAYVDRYGVVDAGILIGERSVWGQGYGSEAWQSVCRALLDGGARKVTAGTLSVNQGMLKIMDRAGMVPDGRRVRQCLVGGDEVDVVFAALFADG